MVNLRQFLSPLLKPSSFLTQKKGIIDVLGLIVFCFLLFSFQLGNRPLATPDEARYVEIPREMVVSGDWITPRLNGVKYFEKPPLFYWLQAISFKLFGLNEAAMRLWPVLFAILGCLGVYGFGRSTCDRQTGLLAAFILATSVLYFSLARLIILDMVVSVYVTLALFCFYQGLTSSKIPNRPLWFYGFSAACGLGILAKGLMALVLLGPILFLWLTYTKQWHRLRPFYPVRSLLIFLAVTVPWHVLVSLKNPEFVHKYFIVEHLLRYTTTLHARYKPFWFFIPIIVAGILPWTIFLKTAWLQFWHNRQESLGSFLWIWILWTTGFFSLSNSKLIPYILPIFPPLALVLAHSLRSLFSASPFPSVKQRIFYQQGGLFILLGIGGALAQRMWPDLLDNKIALIPYLDLLSSLFTIQGILTLLFAQYQRFKACLLTTGVTALLIAILLTFASPYAQRPSVKDLVQIILNNQKNGEPIVSFLTYLQDLPVYSQQKVIVVGPKGELEFGTTVEDTSSWMIEPELFLHRWHQARQEGKKIWVVGRHYDLEHFKKAYPNFHYHFVASSPPYVLFIP